MFELSDAHLIKEGVSGKDEVLKLMGSPTIASYINEETWIYFSEEKKYLLFFKPKTINRDVLVVKFDEENIVKNLIKLNLNDENKELAFSTKYTEVADHETSAFKSIFGNIGQVRAVQ